jgi:hypothetical protein
MNKKIILKWWKAGKNVWEISQLTGTPESLVTDVIEGRPSTEDWHNPDVDHGPPDDLDYYNA